MPLKVLSVAFPFAPVGPHGVGGAEQVLSDIDQALIASGRESIVIACEGSDAAGKLIRIPAPAQMDATSQAACRAHVQAALDDAICRESPDIIHMHGLDFHEYTLPRDIPVVVTLHLPIGWYPAQAWTAHQADTQFVCVSESQRHTCPPELSGVIVIENGVSIPEAPVYRGQRSYALVLGRICPEKNAHEALEAGTRAGIPVLLGGQVFPYPDHRRYFDEKIAPLLARSNNAVQHRFLGPLDPEQRNQLLSEAICLLHPTLAPETSSLAAMESLAAGTPVIAYPSGALSEIVSHGVTGLLVNNIAEMAEALHAIGAISPQACRAAAEQRFRKERMIRDYMALYESLLRPAATHAARPEALHV
jgi:glycosyltransferase involved in cell wall biosynthesis